MNDFLFALFLFLPAGYANSAPLFANKIPGLNKWKTPLDFGKTFRGKPIFGPNKTWRGLFSGAVVGGVVSLLIGLLLPKYSFKNPELLQHLGTASYFWFGVVLGVGALLFDAIESFFKRQVGIASGESWFPFDQLDYIIGGVLFSLFFIRLGARDYAAVFVVYFGLHLLVSYIGYLIGFKEKPI